MAERRVQRRLAAILAADAVGYSRLMAMDEVGTRARFNLALEGIAQPTIDEHRGRLVKTLGDGFLVEFASVVDAIQCAVDIQNEIASQQRETPDTQRMLFRIGIHLGDVIVEGEDIHGDGVNIASRLEGHAEPGGIHVSAMVREGVRNKLDIEFSDLGECRLKNIADPVHIYAVKSDVPAAAPRLSSRSEAMFRRPAVAVLPFENLSGDPEQDYFADGLTEDIITALSLWRSFPVIARNSTFAYKGTSPDVREVGDELGARYVVEGSVRKAGNRVRVTAQLIDAASGLHVWAQKFDRNLEDIFAVQDEITKRIAATVVPELEKLETRRSSAEQPRNLHAWDCYLRGLSFLHKSTKEGNVRAHEMFERALELDASFGPAFTGLAYLVNRDLLFGDADSYEVTAAKCLELARHAVELDEAAAISRTELVRALLWTRQYEAAIQEARKAVGLNPSNAVAHAWLGAALAFAGRDEEAIPWLEEALDLAPQDPRNQFFMIHLALAYLSLGQLDKALEWARVAALKQSDFVEAPQTLASVLGHMGEMNEAQLALKRLGNRDPGSLEGRPFWRLYKEPDTMKLVLDGLRAAGLPEG